MKKSLIALAVVGLFSASAFAATGNVDAYGKLRVSLSNIDPDGGDSAWELGDQTSRIGFKGSEDLGGGLKGLWQIEQGLGGSGVTGGMGGATSIASRNTFVGLGGAFGTVLAGRHDTPYKLAGSADVFGDTLADATGGAAGSIIGDNGFDLRADRALAYISPDFSGFHAAVAIVPGASADNELTDAYSLALVYGNGPLKVTFGYEDHNNIAEETAMKLNGSYNFGDLTVGATYETQDREDAGGEDVDAYLISATYGMGPITLAAQFGDKSEDGDDRTRTTLGAIYSLSKRTNAAIAYNIDDADAGDFDAFTVQLNHDF